MDAFIARQPIFDRNQKVFAYELLFRSGLDNYFNASNEAALDQASSKVIGDSILIHGLDTLTAGKKGFYNMSRETLLKEYYAMLPKDQTVVEILENVEPDPEVIAACKKIKESGYGLALDDFVDDDRFKPMVALCDIIKVDFIQTQGTERGTVIHDVGASRIEYLAEKVETQEDFEQAVDLGYSYFQGYYFSKPQIIAGHDVPAHKLNYLQILNEINQPEVDFDELEKVFKQDLSLSYKLLNYMNSVHFGFKNKIRSIKHALSLLGIDESKKWLSLFALQIIGKDKSEELLSMSLIRANSCEMIAPLIGCKNRASELFLMGLFSMIDALLDQPLEGILAKLPLADDIKKALLGEKNQMREVFELVVNYEKGDWVNFSEYAARLSVKETELIDIFQMALEKATQSFQLI
ncbi:HDOD domain-containing protein [candidate division KSB1 bacterium]|nr:HDOD domain-containing protein [candidate division KSB1 bacterium]